MYHHPSELVDLYRRDRRSFEYEMDEVRRRDRGLWEYVMREVDHMHRERSQVMSFDPMPPMPKTTNPKQTINKNLLLLEGI